MRGADAFFDTNVVLYLLSADSSKADAAEQAMARGGRLSVQVLNEIASVARRKLGFSWREVRDLTAELRAACTIEPLTIETHEHGVKLAETLRISLYDAMIVASALLAGCATLYTEDLQDGRVVEGKLTIRNPFKAHRT